MMVSSDHGESSSKRVVFAQHYVCECDRQFEDCLRMNHITEIYDPGRLPCIMIRLANEEIIVIRITVYQTGPKIRQVAQDL